MDESTMLIEYMTRISEHKAAVFDEKQTVCPDFMDRLGWENGMNPVS